MVEIGLRIWEWRGCFHHENLPHVEILYVTEWSCRTSFWVVVVTPLSDQKEETNWSVLRDGQRVSSVNALSPSSAFWGLELIMAVTLFSWIPPALQSSSSSPSFASQIHHHIIILGSLESLQGRDRRYPQWSGVMMVQTLISSRL